MWAYEGRGQVDTGSYGLAALGESFHCELGTILSSGQLSLTVM